MPKKSSHKLRLVRERQGLSLRQAAAKARVSLTALWNIEHGHGTNVQKALRLAKCYGTTVEKLFRQAA